MGYYGWRSQSKGCSDEARTDSHTDGAADRAPGGGHRGGVTLWILIPGAVMLVAEFLVGALGVVLVAAFFVAALGVVAARADRAAERAASESSAPDDIGGQAGRIVWDLEAPGGLTREVVSLEIVDSLDQPKEPSQ
jgi:hypothetical protein